MESPEKMENNPGWQLRLVSHRGSSSHTLHSQSCLRIRDHPSKNLQDLLSLANSPIHQDPRKALQRELLTGGYRRQKQHAAVHLTPRYSTTPLQRCCANGKDKSWTSWWKVHAVMFREKHHIPQNSTAECQAGKLKQPSVIQHNNDPKRKVIQQLHHGNRKSRFSEGPVRNIWTS